jgi:biofilm PGA synthesis lipoprotein PgaB
MKCSRYFRLLLIAATLCLTGPFDVRAAVVLQYHHVSVTTPASTSTSPERFAMHLAYLAGQGFEVVPLAALVQRLRSGQPLDDRTAAITFDDGYRSIYDTAYPLLVERGWPFTVFINSEPHDQRQSGFMSWEQLREMSGNGATIANHTVSHPYLLSRPPGMDEGAWRDGVAAEITSAQRRIEDEIGVAPKLLAYPYGEYNEAVLEIVGELGFTGFGQQSGPLADYSDLRVLPRFPFGGIYGDAADFTTKVNSLPMPLAPGTASIGRETGDGQPLADIVFTDGDVRPVLALRFEEEFDTGRINCFASGQGRAQLLRQNSTVRVQAERGLGPGRSRYNCTAPSGQAGRFFWYSQLWIVRP